MPETTIFRRLDGPEEDYLTKVQAVEEMDSTDSSHTGVNSASERTTITVHRVKKEKAKETIRPESVEDSVQEEEQQQRTGSTDVSPNTIDTEPTNLTTKGEDASSSNSNRTAFTNPITPDTSIDGNIDLQHHQTSLLKNNSKTNDEDSCVTSDEDEVQGSRRGEGETTGNAERDGGETEREATPSKDVGYDSTDSAAPLSNDATADNQTTTATNKNKNSSGKRQSYSNNNNNNLSSSSRRLLRRNSRSLRDDESSSDDDSSYFATHLPSPKSGRSYSFSSNASNASAYSNYSNNQYQIHKQGSDASLSFSDESSDEDHNNNRNHRGQQQGRSQIITSGVHLSPVVNPNRAVVDMSLYPQRITRMHSVSSLVSSASSDNRDGDASEGEDGPNRRRSFTGDDSVTSSLPSIASTGPEAMHRTLEPGYYAHGASLNNHNYHQHPQAAYLSQPQPPGMQFYSQQPPLTNQQMMAWTTPPSDAEEFEYTSSEYTSETRNNSNNNLNNHNSEQQPHTKLQQQQAYSILTTSQGIPKETQRSSGGGNALKSQSSGSLHYVYSESDDAAATIGLSTTTKNGQSLFAASSSMGKQQAAGSDFTSNRNNNNNGRGDSGIGGNNQSEPSGRLGRGGGPSDRGSQQSSNDAAALGTPASESASLATAVDKDLVVASGGGGRKAFKVYWQRWIMLFYMSVLNLLSDWTCYSVAPISMLTEEAFGNIDPERLVVIFLGANAIATACEPMILARLGLRRTVLLGSLLLTIGSMVKSGGLPPLMEPDLQKGHAQWSLYLGFFIVGLSQPLYQCTPALLSASWFPEEERTMATGVALNANQLGIGFAFIFGTLLVSKADDILPYFGLLSQISTLCFIGTLIQFDDAPPTPPSSSARVMKGNLNFKMPNFQGSQIQRYFSSNREQPKEKASKPKTHAPTPASSNGTKKSSSRKKSSTRSSSSGTGSSSKRGSSTRRRNNNGGGGSKASSSKFQTANSENGLSPAAPSSAHYGSTADAIRDSTRIKSEMESLAIVAHAAPSPAMQGDDSEGDAAQGGPFDESNNTETPPLGQMPPGGPQGAAYPPGQIPGYFGYGYPPPPPEYQYYQQQMQMQQQAFYHQQMYHQQQMQQQQLAGQPPPMMGPGMPPQPMPYFPPPQQMAMPYSYQQNPYNHHPLPPYGGGPEYRSSDAYDIDAFGDEGAEPTVIVTNHHLDIDIRDDQVIRSLHACMIRPGFSHALAAFTVSGIVINTLSTYMDYLVRLDGAPRSYTGIVGGSFQFIIMISSLIMGKQTDKTRAYYSVTTGMLVLGAFGLAECGVSLDSNRGGDLRWSLLLVAVLVGPLQPISTELGVEVAYPLSENTVLVIQQLFSNLLSAIFIPFFKSLKDIGTTVVRGNEVIERPEFTFSFYLLIVLHTLVTVYFATFNGRYLRYEHELKKKEEEEAEEDAEQLENQQQATAAARSRSGEYAPLVTNHR